MVMQDSHVQPGVGTCISWLPAHASSTGQCCLSTDLISGLLNTFHPEFSWQWLMGGYQFWVFRENQQKLNQMWFFPHPCLDHLHDEYRAWDPQRGGPEVTDEETVCARCPSSLTPVCCLFACWVQSVTLVAILNNPFKIEDTLEEIFPHWVLLQDQPGLIRVRSGLFWEAQDGLPSSYVSVWVLHCMVEMC